MPSYTKLDFAYKSGLLEKFFSDFDGSISLMKKGTARKIKITSQSNPTNGFVLTTLTLDELSSILEH